MNNHVLTHSYCLRGYNGDPQSNSQRLIMVCQFLTLIIEYRCPLNKSSFITTNKHTRICIMNGNFAFMRKILKEQFSDVNWLTFSYSLVWMSLVFFFFFIIVYKIKNRLRFHHMSSYVTSRWMNVYLTRYWWNSRVVWSMYITVQKFGVYKNFNAFCVRHGKKT